MKKKNIFFGIIAILILSLTFSVNFVFAICTNCSEANNDNNINSASNNVNSIKLSGDGANISWNANGYSNKGFKVSWSKNAGPTYPARSGDKYHYHSSPSKISDTLTAFSGDGTYYVRVCEYLGGVCGVYSNEIIVELKEAIACTMDYNPVCGKNGKTYSNKCVLDASGAEKAYYGECKNIFEGVKSITLTSGGTTVKWSVDGYSKKGFKVVWSKNTGPTYPTRNGDKYHYYSDPNYYYDKKLTAFSGDGVYYVRVCEYLGGACGVYSNEVIINLESDEEIKNIEVSAKKLANNQLDEILTELEELRNLVKEQQNQIKHLQRLLVGVAAVTEKMQDSINQFITYGVDENTKNLGEGERAAVMYSFKSAFGKLPEDEAEMADAIKIANGRWPSKVSKSAEDMAQDKFEYIYKREAVDGNASDNAAVTIIAYGLRQRAKNRNLNSERQGIKIFQDIFKRLPETTEDWNTMQAITYSGATR